MIKQAINDPWFWFFFELSVKSLEFENRIGKQPNHCTLKASRRKQNIVMLQWNFKKKAPYSSSKDWTICRLKPIGLECLLMASLNTDSAAILSDSSAPGDTPIRPVSSWRFTKCSIPTSIFPYCSPLCTLNSSLSFRRSGTASAWKVRRITQHLNLKHFRTGNPARWKTSLSKVGWLTCI